MALALGMRLKLAAKALVGLYTDQSATQAFGLLSGLYPGAAGATPSRGTKQILEGYSSLPWLRAVSARIAQSVATTQWVLYAPTDRRRNRTVQRAMGPERKALIKQMAETGDLEPLDSHILLDALSNSNDYLVGPALMRTTQIHLDLVGESFWIKERNGLGAPVGFWPLPPHWVIDTPTPKGRWYRVSFSGWQGQIPDSEILWLCDPDPANPYGRGSGIARTLVDELETDEYAARHTRMTFLNRARPDLIIWPEAGKNDSGVISEATAQALGERWRNEHQGFWRAALPFFATRKIGVHEVSQSFQDLQLTELRKYERDMIVQVFGVMPEELGIVRDGALNRAALDSVDFLFKTNLIVPRIEFLQAYMQERLIPEYDERLVLDYVSPVQADRQYNLDAAKAAPWALTVDEWRLMQGLDPLPDGAGNVFVMPSNMTSTTGHVTPLPVFASGSPVVTRGATEEAEWLETREACAEARDADGVVVAQRELEDNPEDLPELSRRVAKRETAVRRWAETQLVALRERTPEDALARAVERKDEDAAADALPVEAWGAAVATGLSGFLREAFLIGVQQGAADAGVTLTRAAQGGRVPWNVVNPEAVAWSAAHSGTLVTGFRGQARETMLRSLRKVLHDALDKGWSAAKTARVLRETIGLTPLQGEAVLNFARRLADKEGAEALSDAAFFKRVGRYTEALVRQRALMIARTELAHAASAGQQRLWQIAGARGQLLLDRMERVWIATPDERLCEQCGDLDHTTAPVMGTFQDGTTRPPRHPNCRCATGLRAKAIPTRGVDGAMRPADAVRDGVAKGLAGLAAEIDAVVGGSR